MPDYSLPSPWQTGQMGLDDEMPPIAPQRPSIPNGPTPQMAPIEDMGNPYDPSQNPLNTPDLQAQYSDLGVLLGRKIKDAYELTQNKSSGKEFLGGYLQNIGRHGLIGAIGSGIANARSSKLSADKNLYDAVNAFDKLTGAVGRTSITPVTEGMRDWRAGVGQALKRKSAEELNQYRNANLGLNTYKAETAAHRAVTADLNYLLGVFKEGRITQKQLFDGLTRIQYRGMQLAKTNAEREAAISEQNRQTRATYTAVDKDGNFTHRDVNGNPIDPNSLVQTYQPIQMPYDPEVRQQYDRMQQLQPPTTQPAPMPNAPPPPQGVQAMPVKANQNYDLTPQRKQMFQEYVKQNKIPIHRARAMFADQLMQRFGMAAEKADELARGL